MFNFYKYSNQILFSINNYPEFSQITQIEAQKCVNLFFLHKLNPSKSKRSFSVSDPSLLFLKKEGIESLEKSNFNSSCIPHWILDKIRHRKVRAINTEYPNWKDLLRSSSPSQWKVNIVGTGDVGGICATGLRLLGGSHINEIGLYSIDSNSAQRWKYEINQIVSPSNNDCFPEAKLVKETELFDCELFIFCASAGVPPLGEEKKDVRMIQFEKNKEIISIYAKLARKNKFNGIFAVLSDPVDLLCKSALISSNTNDDGSIDFLGLAPEQIRGYGLGVMHARALYYSQTNDKTKCYATEGRAYGPHGNGLVIANSIENYDNSASLYLTEKAQKSNLEIRNTGYKPFIAPALSSGTLSILATIKGEWHYSSTYMGGVFMGSKNRLNDTGIEVEQLCLPNQLRERLMDSYKELSMIL